MLSEIADNMSRKIASLRSFKRIEDYIDASHTKQAYDVL